MADTSADYEVEKIVAKRVKGVEVRNNVFNLFIAICYGFNFNQYSGRIQTEMEEFSKF